MKDFLKMNPKISIIMPVFNCENFVAQSIESILNQSFKDFEFIIIDGGSSDGTVKIIRKYKDKRLKIIEHRERFDLIKSLNEGLDTAEGEIIARQDADDISNPKRLAKQFHKFHLDNDLAVLGTSYICIDEKDRMIKKEFLKKEVRFTDFKQGNRLCHGSVMFRKDIVLKENGYDPFFISCEDYELLCRIGSKGYKIMNLNKPLYYLRVHDRSVSAIKWQEQILYTCLVKDIYFGNLKKDIIKELPTRDHKHLYSILSPEAKKDYHLSLARKYIKSKQYINGLNEFLKLAKLNPKEANRLIIAAVQNPSKVLDETW